VTAEEQGEYGRMVKVLDMAVARIVPPCWPLALPAVQLLREVEAHQQPYHCAMCGLRKGHRCHCPVTTARRRLRLRAREAA
jgi:hypothetical protein